MTSATRTYTTEDYKKYIFAEGRAYIARIGDVIEALNEHHDLDQENYEDLTCMLDQAICYLNRAAFADDHGQPLRTVEEVSTFDDGRPVSTTVHFDEDEGDQYIEHAWHPDPNHPDNQVGAWHEYSWGPVPFRYRHIEITGPGTFTVHKEEDLEAEREAKLAGLSDDERRVHFAYQMALDTNRPHRTHSDMAKQLGMTREQIDVIAEKLTERGLLNNAWGRLTENQKRVLMTLPSREQGHATCPTPAQLAEQLGMSLEDVRECVRVLNNDAWLWSHEPDSVLDALMVWGWQTPADELAQRLHIDIGEVEQRLRELADIGYQVRLI
jgi:DNA-binding MarR family transcriptional regulator